MIGGWRPARSSQETTVSLVSETTASYVFRSARSLMIAKARRSISPPGSKPSTAAFSGSSSVMKTKRALSARPRWLLRIPLAASISSGESGSSGWRVVATEGSTVCMGTLLSHRVPSRRPGQPTSRPARRPLPP